MLIKAVVTFLLVMIALAFLSGPAFRRMLRDLLGLRRDDR